MHRCQLLAKTGHHRPAKMPKFVKHMNTIWLSSLQRQNFCEMSTRARRPKWTGRKVLECYRHQPDMCPNWILCCNLPSTSLQQQIHFKSFNHKRNSQQCLRLLSPSSAWLKQVTLSHTRCRAPHQKPIPVYRQSARRWFFKSSPGREAAITFRQACSYLPSRRTSQSFDQYQVILHGDRQRHIGCLLYTSPSPRD